MAARVRSLCESFGKDFFAGRGQAQNPHHQIREQIAATGRRRVGGIHGATSTRGPSNGIPVVPRPP